MPQATQELPATGKNLQLFHHQVAGQSLVFLYDERTICKTLIPREDLFYRNVPDVLKPFIPTYQGVREVVLEKTEGGLLSQAHADSHVEAVQRHLDKVSKSDADNGAYHFILLENIVAGFRYPCVLDLKLGTRQHGDDAPSEKVTYQVNKCLNTTSAKLGVRLCGMKIFDSITGDCIAFDKMQGRAMRERDFREAIETFLLTGYRFHKDIITVILQQLKKLHAAIGQLPTYRFYACSLLIVYDSDFENDILRSSDFLPEAECGSTGEGMRTLNGTFEAKALGHNGEVLGDSHADGDSPTLTASDPDSDAASVADVRYGDASGHVTLSAGVAEETRLCQPDAAGERNAYSASSKGFRSAVDGSMSEGLMTTTMTTTTTKRGIDVRMVDFAHSTFKGFGSDAVVHEGVDRGCLLGLETLIKIVSEMKLSTM